MLEKEGVERAYLKFVREYRDINGTGYTTFDCAPTALEFLQRCVLPNRPAVIKGACDDWSALKRWTDEYLCGALAGNKVTVSVTPNGYADAVTHDPITEKDYFVMPLQEQMTFDAFLPLLHGTGSVSAHTDQPAYYISLQNGSLNQEFTSIADDVPKDIAWCTEALGHAPDAVNFWYGNRRSITSLHKDPYENCYAAIRGSKTFILYPPAEYACLYESVYPAAQYTLNEAGQFDISPQDGIQVPWIPVDPLQPDFVKFPRFRHARPVVITITEGEMLYLPALWFHQVMQDGDQGSIAVNYWYDMNMSNMLYPAMGFFRRLGSNLLDGQPAMDEFESDED
ncbi:putative pla2g4b [Gongronella butleri]|nr:putative pla2g4b [Gongronella butleri]